MNAVFLFVFSKHWYPYVVGGHKQEAPVHYNVVQYNNLIKNTTAVRSYRQVFHF